MKATDLLKKQHKEVERLFGAYEKLDDDDRKQELAEEIATNLAAHSKIEKDLFYPALARAVDDEEEKAEMLYEALEEHAVVEYHLAKTLMSGSKDAAADAKIKVLKDLVMHHVGEEEREIFKEAEKSIGRELEQLGQRMEQLFMRSKQLGAEKLLEDSKDAMNAMSSRAARPRAQRGRKQRTSQPARKQTRAKRTGRTQARKTGQKSRSRRAA